MSEKKLLAVIWTVAVGLGLLFAHGVYAVDKPSITVDGDVVTMDKKTFEHMVKTIESQQAMLNRSNSMVMYLEQKYAFVEKCVRDSAANGNATMPCFNADPTDELSFNQYKRFKNNTLEF